ncbi:gamma-butyrobetaine hydroxylase-like domain-containing protein [Candidatus Spongiihabitans sp.]|uniref:gamma-butyrobetaine hydroxylase-like domain-containing protein n=1 Tax=Candidatus Spongiihabitans sp. TaxID=3101308 RepID=UPI003C6FC418
MMSKHVPTEINLNRRTRILTVTFDDESFDLSCEYLRVHSPSAEVKGHGPGQEVLQIGKEHVNIDAIEPVGNYAIKPVFDDGHDTGIFSWETLYELGKHQAENWAIYTQRLDAAGHSRKLDA